MEPGATQPVMDQAIFARSIFNQLKGRWNGSNTPIPLGRTGLGRYRLRQAVDQVRGHAPEQWCARGRPAAILYARAITTYFDLQAGLRSDIDSRPTRNWAAFGIQGLAPYFFDLEPTGYVSGQGHLAAKLEASYDLLLTQRLILQPQIELNLYSKADPARLVGAGFSDIDTGLRLRYEFDRKFAPYIGVVYQGKFGQTANFARQAGESTGGFRFAFGVRVWF